MMILADIYIGLQRVLRGLQDVCIHSFYNLYHIYLIECPDCIFEVVYSEL